jgi:hypothetical protein
MTSRTASSSLLNFLVCFGSLLVFTTGAHGETSYEVRSPLGIAPAWPNELNSATAPSLHVNATLGFGADALAEFTDFHGLALGLRFDSISSVRSDGTDDGHKLEIAARIFSLIARKTWRSGTFYWGPAGGVGVYMPSDINVRSASGNWTRYTSGNPVSVHVGAEAGWVWDIFLVSFESGYHLLRLSDLAAKDGTKFSSPSGAEVSADLSAPYVRLLLGLRL